MACGRDESAEHCFLLPQHDAKLKTIFHRWHALGFEMFGYGFGFVGLILYMMQVVAVGKFKTAHYALATGVMQLGLVIPKMISGEIQTRLGYQNFFIWF